MDDELAARQALIVWVLHPTKEQVGLRVVQKRRSMSGRARPIAIRWRSGRDLLPHQLRSIDGARLCKKSSGYSQQTNDFTPPIVYTNILLF